MMANKAMILGVLSSSRFLSSGAGVGGHGGDGRRRRPRPLQVKATTTQQCICAKQF